MSGRQGALAEFSISRIGNRCPVKCALIALLTCMGSIWTAFARK